VDDEYGALPSEFVSPSNRAVGQGEFLSLGRLDVAPVRADLFDVSCVPFTAGTSGVSKGVITPWGLWPERCQSPIIPEKYRNDDTVYYSTLPFFHTGGRVYFYRAMYDGGRIVVREVFSTDDWLDDIRAHGCNETIIIGSMATFLHNAPVRENDGDNPMRHVVVSPVAPWIDEFKERYQIEVDTAFGSTETLFPIVSGGIYEVNSTTYSSCGKRDMSIDFRLVDEQGIDVGPDEPGEVLVRGVPWKCNFGYWGMPEATAEVWRDGWFHTGDSLRYDEEGFYYFVDRMKDALRRRGENISSAEVETVVMRHPYVTDAAVFGVPSQYGEEEVMLVVVPRTGAEIDVEELHRYLQGALPYFAVPSFVDVVESLPSSSIGRIDKKALKAKGVTESTWVRLQDRRSSRESSS
jgi:carnitine-CoA ligase